MPEGDVPLRVRIKICGLTRPDEAVCAAQAGADWLGLNFHPDSPRRIDEGTAAAIIAALPATSQAVGLFVNSPPREVAGIAARLGLQIVQLHGDEPPEHLLELAQFQIIRAFRLADLDSVVQMEAYLERADRLGRLPDAVLVDAYAGALRGGTGQTIALDVLNHLPRLSRLILAGGLTPENVAERVARVRPWMVDVSSGVESSPGRKDPQRVASFVRAALGG